MKIIGISGGSGAGKSTVSRRLAEVFPNSLFVNVDPYFREATDKYEEEIFKKIGIKNHSEFFCQNYFFYTYENMQTWIDVVKDYVTEKIEEDIAKNGKGKEYVIVDWCYLPMCDYFKKCDYTLCVKADNDLRFERLSNRMKAVNGYSIEKGPTFEQYRLSSFKNRIKYSAIDDYGYKSQFLIKNDADIDTLYGRVDKFASSIINGNNEVKKFFEFK